MVDTSRTAGTWLKRYVLRVACMLLLLLGSTFFAPKPALAAFANMPDSTWMTNGSVRAVVRAGDVIYVGGQFTQVRPCRPGTYCKGILAVANIAALDADTGVANPSFRPDITSETGTPIVYALAVLDGKLFIGGKFTAVNGQPRKNFAAVDLATGALDANVDAMVGSDASDHIRALLAAGNRIYIGGLFGSVDGIVRTKLAAFDTNGNLDLLWRPRTSRVVSSLALACDGQSIFVGGAFRTAAGSGRSYVPNETIARFDLINGILHPWQITPGLFPDDVTVTAWDMAVTCDRLFVAYGGSKGLNFAMAIDITDGSGDMVWGIKADGDVQAVAVRSDRVLFGGHFEVIGPKTLSRFAVLGLDGKFDDTWTPTFDHRFFGPWDILAGESQVWIGGHYTYVSGVEHWGIARFTSTPD